MEHNAFSKKKLLFLVLLSFAGIMYSLYLSNQKAHEINDIESQKPLPAPVVKPQKNENYLPPKPEEKWSYIETLENKRVQVEANKQEVSERPYLMQCGAYREETYAEARKASIAFQGLEGKIKTSEINGGTWFRVVLGPYDLKRSAERDRNLLRRAGIEPCKIWFWED